VRLLRQGLEGVREPWCVAVMPMDFHDLVVRICPDFPATLVLEAAEHAHCAGAWRCWRLLGSQIPVPLGGAEMSAAAGVEGSQLRVFESLQRLVEFCFVYSELVFVMKHVFAEEAVFGRVSRTTLVSELRRGGRALPGGALPSEGKLLRLLAAPAGTAQAAEASGASSASQRARQEGKAVVDPETVSYGKALVEMAHHFDLLPPAYVPNQSLTAAAAPAAAAAAAASASVMRPALESASVAQGPS